MRRLDALRCRNGHGMLVKDPYKQAYFCPKCGYGVYDEDLCRMGIRP